MARVKKPKPDPVVPAVEVLPPKRSKYRAVKTVVDGITFDSKKEAARYGDLKLLEKEGKIRDLRLQPPYQLVVNGVKIGRYQGDFLYLDCATGREVLEDVKGMKTAIYRLKKKLVLALHGVEIVEV